MKKLVSLLLVMVMAVTLFAGCGKKAQETSGDSSTAEKKTEAKTEAKEEVKAKKFAIIVKNTGNPYNEKEMEGFEKAN